MRCILRCINAMYCNKMHQCELDYEEIYLLDIVSFHLKSNLFSKVYLILIIGSNFRYLTLFPYVMKYCEFPIGYPTLLARETFANMQPWTKPETIHTRVSYIVEYQLQIISKGRFSRIERKINDWFSPRVVAARMNTTNSNPQACRLRDLRIQNSTKLYLLATQCSKSSRFTGTRDGPTKAELEMNFHFLRDTLTRSSR